MITKKNIIDMAKHVVRRDKNVPDRRIMHPKRDWAIGLIIFFSIIATGFVYNSKQFERFSNLEEELVESPSDIVQYKNKKIKEVLEIYSAKEKRLAELLNYAPEIVLVEEGEIATTSPLAATTTVDGTAEGKENTSVPEVEAPVVLEEELQEAVPPDAQFEVD